MELARISQENIKNNNMDEETRLTMKSMRSELDQIKSQF